MSGRLRILIATDAFPPNCGGSGWSTFYLARALAARGHTVEVAQPQQGLEGTQADTYQGLRVVRVGYTATNVPILRAWQRAVALEKKFSTYLAARASEFDLIHAQHLLTIPAAIHAKKKAGIPVVSTVRDYWHICLYGTLWRDGAACSICRGSEITRCLANKYGGAARWMLPLVPFAERELARRQQALRESNGVIAVSHYVAATLRGSVPAEKLWIVPNLVDVEEMQRLAAAEPEVSYPPAFLLFVGKLNSLKGADVLPEIMYRSGVRLPLLVIGDGELQTALARVPGIKVLGWLPNVQVLRLLARATALLFPSHWAEPLARTLLEAQALGTPTVALNRGGTRDIITITASDCSASTSDWASSGSDCNNPNGLLVDTLDEFAAQLTRLVNDPALQARLRENAQCVARERFSSQAVGDKIEAVYESVLG